MLSELSDRSFSPASDSQGTHSLAAAQVSVQINKSPDEKGNERFYSKVPQFRVADFCPEIPVSLGHSARVIFGFGGLVFFRGGCVWGLLHIKSQCNNNLKTFYI